MSDSTSTTEMKDSTKTVRTDRPKSISGLTGRARDEAVREKLSEVRAGVRTKGQCGGTAPGWDN
jgi:hypothetical protein